MKKLLIIEPYFGGSHKYWLEGLCRELRRTVSDNTRQTSVGKEEIAITLLTLPPRKWKIRMQLSAQWVYSRLGRLLPDERFFHTVLCSSLVDVAVLRSLLPQLKGFSPETRFVTYFHENQFAYPRRDRSTPVFQFTAINFSSALASDGVAFNSAYNLKSFLQGCSKGLRIAADMEFPGLNDELRKKCRVIYPGIDYRLFDAAESTATRTDLSEGTATSQKNGPPVIVWNHRWEHDKGPNDFFQALYSLQAEDFDFSLILLGQSFRDVPDCFAEARQQLGPRILHFGYANSRAEYASLLRRGDIVVSTARHEFFGIAIMEAVRSGCMPLLPKRLAYPELFSEEFLYEPGNLAERLASLLQFSRKERASHSKKLRTITDRYSWEELIPAYRSWLFGE